jgi:predicted metallopeptidase
MEWEEAQDVKNDIEDLLRYINLPYIKSERIFVYRTYGSKSSAYARIWCFPKIFQKALNIHSAYVIEVISEKYDKLDTDTKKKVLIHELLHIPKNFSGSLLPHRTRSRNLNTMVKRLFQEYKKNNQV